MSRVKPWWDVARLEEELELASGTVALYEARQPLATPNQKRLAEWREFEHELRNRVHVARLNAEIDALEVER